MQADEKELGERVLRHLLLGAQVGGIRFGPILQLLITDIRVKGQAYINLPSRWVVFPTMPPTFPHSEEDVPELDEDEGLRALCGLREQEITAVRLGDAFPHLILTLESGKVLFLNGNDDHYESWDCGVAFGGASERWQVVATPGGGLAIWAPEAFA